MWPTKRRLVIFISICFVTQILVNCAPSPDKNRALDKIKLERSDKKKQALTKYHQKPIWDKKFTPKKGSLDQIGGDHEQSDETQKLCTSMEEDSLTDFMTKFGMITHLIEDINDFRAKIKENRGRQSKEDKLNNDWKLKKKVMMGKGKNKYFSRRLNQKVDQPNKEVKPGHALSGRNKKNQDSVPICFGYEYLMALEATEDGHADIQVLEESLSDMLSMQLSTQILEIFEECDTRKVLGPSTVLCPAVDSNLGQVFDDTGLEEQRPGQTSDCEESCLTDDDCGSSGETCCPNSCGGHFCSYPPKWVSAKNERQGKPNCENADTFLQCLYDQVKDKICSK